VRLPGRGGREREGRVVAIEESTLARAGDAATRLALEETLMRRGWRVLFFDEEFGPLFGPERPRLFDGIAVRLRPGTEDRLELRLVRAESDTLEAPREVIERVKRAANAASLDWLVAAFDGESMRVVPPLDEIEGVAARPSPPAAALLAAPRPETTARAAAGRRRPPPKTAPAHAPTAAVPPGARRTGADRAASRESAAARESATAREGGILREGGEPGAQPAKRGRRRGKRGGRRRSGRRTA
jgi:hypothetical protein